MSSGKLRRERSRSRERPLRKEDDIRSETGRQERSPDVAELNEEEYDEQWEHEWEDIDEIGKGRSRFPLSHGRANYQKWRGRNQSRGQHRFNKWERSVGSDNFSENSRRPGRRQMALEEDEILDMDPGVEMTNLKVKIQDGKRFAEPDEFDREMTKGRKNNFKFSRGRGTRGHHGSGRDRWNQGKFKHPQPDELVDCREVLNRRKRNHPDPSESDLREKLLKKDTDLGDLREIIEARDHGIGDLRDLIDEPPDISLMDEFSEEIPVEIQLQEDIRIQNEYFEEVRSEANGNSEREFPIADYELNDQFDFVEEPDLGGLGHRDVVIQDQDDWRQGRWQRSRSKEMSFGQAEGWSNRNRQRAEIWRKNQLREEGHIPDQRSSSRNASLNASPRSRSRDRSRNRSRERVKSPPRRNFRATRGDSFDRGLRMRGPSWEREKSFGSVSSRSRGVERSRRGSFERDGRMNEEGAGRRQFSPENSGLLSFVGDQRRLRNPPLELGRRERERSEEQDRTRRQPRSISQDALRVSGRDRSRSHERRFRRGSQEGNLRRRSVSAERGRMLRQELNQERGSRRERDRKRSPHQERNWSATRVPDREMGHEGSRNFEQERTRNFSQERTRNYDQERSRNFNQERNRNFSQERNTIFGQDRNKSFNQERAKNLDTKRSADRDFVRMTRWDSGNRNSRDRSPRADSGINLGRERIRSPNWGGPRTPSAESYRDQGWDGPKSPARERSRSRGRIPCLQTCDGRDGSRGREAEGRIRDQRDRGVLRAKDTERREKTQDMSRRRDQDGPSNRLRAVEKDSGVKLDKTRKRDHEDPSNKERGRGIPRSPDRRNEDKIIKTPQMLVEEFKQRYVRDSGKVEKYDRRDDYLLKQEKDTVGQQRKLSGGEQDSREWENIRDFQERRNAQSIVGLPFLDESRRQRDSSSHNQQPRSQLSRGERTQGKSETHPPGNQSRLSSTVHQTKDSTSNWQNPDNRQTFNHQEEDRRRSRWGSPSRRDKPSDLRESHKSATYSSQSAAINHQSSSNGKADADFWRRNLPSLGDSQSQWNKPRSDLPSTPGKDSRQPSLFTKHLQSPKEVIFVRGLARDVTEMDIRTDVSNCGLWAKDVRVVHANDTGVSRGLAFITFNSVDEASRWMELRRCVLNLRPNNHAVMEYSNPILKDWECARCLILNFKNRTACYQCNRTKDDCLDGWEETCPYPTNALLLRGLNPLTSIVEISKALKSRMIAHARIDGVRMGTDAKGRPRSVCFVQLLSVTDSMALHKSLVNEPLIIDNCQVSVAYCQLDKLPPMNPHSLESPFLSNVPLVSALPPAIPPTLQASLSSSIPVVARTTTATVVAPPSTPAPAAKPVTVTTASIRSMLEGNYTEKDIPTLAQYCASAYAKNPQEQAAYVRYYTKHYKEKLLKNQTGGGK
ncbi:RNA-binding protein 5 [Frankliniella fusca]|uniref:RNA-binding protein 5 n=1 Tax=Frankliniella fusca TaxID=407009 RepID=A0AAE1HKX9_9NEOP|nr:RNA-binding protein 5 [Frankliniella fusca]